MQATIVQKMQVLGALFSYCAGQLNGAGSAVEDCDDDECGAAMGHVSDAQDVLAIAVAFAEHNDMQRMMEEVQGLDTMVREDVCEGFDEAGILDLLEA